MLAVTGGSDAHDVAYVGTAVTRFDGRDARALRRALLERRTRAHLQWTWTMRKASRHFAVKVRSFRRSRHARPPVATGPRATVSREEEPALVVGAGAAGAGRASR
jgi:hypothetical protein